jgi:predicted GIY-YIG superfamily endonuclease
VTDRDHRTPRYVENGVPLISPRDFINAGIDFSDLKSVDKTEFQAFKKKCNPEKGDILYSRIRTIGEARLLNFDFDFVALHSIALIKPLSKTLDSKYVYYLLQTPDVRSQARHNVKSVGTPDLGLKRIKEFDVPLAPFPQQQLIVAEIEKQFSRLDEAIAGLKHIKANLKRYKASVLKAAVEGKLTEEWRLSARKRAQVDELEGIPKAQAGKWFVYIIECDNGSFYVGHTSDLHARWKAHCEEKAADWTRQYPPKYLIHYEELNSQPEAVKREKDLKTGYGRTWRKREIAACARSADRCAIAKAHPR